MMKEQDSPHSNMLYTNQREDEFLGLWINLYMINNMQFLLFLKTYEL